ncbi:2-oxoglutarate dehydrogenase E1 component [Streptomyces sp. DvalAA-14]|uniref:multifunctional oxoglutarate decarboxylase/oxoglutarate dehydrogenase thiamine pyrophosphate-binding subunit/dihydrolipoyllysine-residue succinyltransferase subunit n=1 Tax=unclassified Streptomyces TaxID=2593676 RepID=UPI00081B7A60|nr:MULTISPECIES: multifunctional oxoglutarate decarboxylase/oxoglutarate dehydrogenase thiamine pyrophosphate-binding subunit/dihydrolipoyllysine-residue succinyltransferase subunit [unclassified Streptomyces]MYS23977.1 multifunctional oxoglutarate decarboxylase/oxoglutarate dehydrogenase thiamine pyrophosphate-binding subunit/dihydrolipoyllysine-residue succinyltransferase subunit [Streptomyces sp. SID4948]SCE41159.1 2-oxoglutarate dehydrogenase E1 component [Streptomyces sp. DvalAA-14]
MSMRVTETDASGPTAPGTGAAGPRSEPLRGAARALAAHMAASLEVPTATSVRAVPAKLLIDNRIVINNHLARARGGKVSFTHLLAWALVRAVRDFPGINVHYAEVDGRPAAVTPAHVNLGIAVDVPRADGSRTLVVPNIKRAEQLSFGEFLAAYDALVSRARADRLTVADFEGTTLSLTNPGGTGTVHSVPRLMAGQSCVVSVGALEYPAEFRGASARTLSDLAVGKTLTLTSTYDHRVVQGAASGEFLRRVHQLLLGEDDFYQDIFAALRIPYAPIRWSADTGAAESAERTAQVRKLINAFRVGGHLMADIDPLVYVQRSHPDLELESHGLTFWDLDREFATGDLAGSDRPMPLREILRVLRDAYCRTVGVEYMHIQDPVQRRWFQERLEAPYTKPSHDEQLRILGKLNEAEVFETFLQTKYVGQTRFSLEGGESAIALLDALMRRAAEEGLDGAALSMAHRGRLNVLTNIAGKTYGQVFREFEGTDRAEGSGDVKYHLGTDGKYQGAAGERLPVTLAANPSHLEAVDAVLLGIARAKQDRHPERPFGTLPVIVHGDAAMAGQGVVAETVQMALLPGYRVGGTVRVNINNQVGFTTLPAEGRSSVYSTDVVKAVQVPVLHVNADDPEAVVRVAELAFAYRQRFHRDVVVDLVCYRRRGHNEADDPSMTQPQMYRLIEARPSVRTLYLESLVGRGDITRDEFEQAHRDFRDRLEQAFAETRQLAAGDGAGPGAEHLTGAGRTAGDAAAPAAEPASTGVAPDELAAVGDAFGRRPAGFAVHPKLDQLLRRREQMARPGGTVDWAFAELLAYGTLLLEGTPVRMAGQDSRRGTFVQRHAVLHDAQDSRAWSPLTALAAHQAPFMIYDSLLSEYAAMGFEYGYSVERPDALVLWEAQFGDFVNGAQIVVDEFVSSAAQKWGQHSSLVLLLPHGHEGSGPDHTSARIERFLQMCAEDNMTVAQPSTAASYFHLLRRQAHGRPRKPLVVFTPKSMLRAKGSASPLADFTSGRFEPVLDDPSHPDPSAVRRLVMVSGKLYHELAARLARQPDPTIALVRIEQLCPLPVEALTRIVDSYPDAELVWAQDEPRNQGAWTYLLSELSPLLPRPLTLISRPASAAPANGSSKRHTAEQADLVARVVTRTAATG